MPQRILIEEKKTGREKERNKEREREREREREEVRGRKRGRETRHDVAGCIGMESRAAYQLCIVV